MMRKISRPASYPPSLFCHGGNPAPEDRIRLDFSASINPLGPPPSVIQALRRALFSITRYPDSQGRRLTERLAALHDVDPTQVILGNGSNDLIYAIARALRPKRVAIVEPTYTEYLKASLLMGAEIDHWLPEGDRFQLHPFDPGPVSLVWLCHPNNPTGQLWPAGACASWIQEHPHTQFVVDEAFLPFLADEAGHSLIPALSRLPNLIVLRSLTKLYALPGLRIGYAVVGRGRDQWLRPHLVPWSVNVLAQEAALAALEDGLFLVWTRDWLQEEGERLGRQLATLSDHLESLPSAANFFLVRLRGEFGTAGWLTRRLAQRGIAVRDASNFIGLDDHFLRIAVRTHEENRWLLEELRFLLEGGE